MNEKVQSSGMLPAGTGTRLLEGANDLSSTSCALLREILDRQRELAWACEP